MFKKEIKKLLNISILILLLVPCFVTLTYAANSFDDSSTNTEVTEPEKPTEDSNTNTGAEDLGYSLGNMGSGVATEDYIYKTTVAVSEAFGISIEEAGKKVSTALKSDDGMEKLNNEYYEKTDKNINTIINSNEFYKHTYKTYNTDSEANQALRNSVEMPETIPAYVTTNAKDLKKTEDELKDDNSTVTENVLDSLGVDKENQEYFIGYNDTKKANDAQEKANEYLKNMGIDKVVAFEEKDGIATVLLKGESNQALVVVYNATTEDVNNWINNDTLQGKIITDESFAEEKVESSAWVKQDGAYVQVTTISRREAEMYAVDLGNALLTQIKSNSSYYTVYTENGGTNSNGEQSGKINIDKNMTEGFITGIGESNTQTIVWNKDIPLTAEDKEMFWKEFQNKIINYEHLSDEERKALDEAGKKIPKKYGGSSEDENPDVTVGDYLNYKDKINPTAAGKWSSTTNTYRVPVYTQSENIDNAIIAEEGVKKEIQYYLSKITYKISKLQVSGDSNKIVKSKFAKKDKNDISFDSATWKEMVNEYYQLDPLDKKCVEATDLSNQKTHNISYKQMVQIYKDWENVIQVANSAEGIRLKDEYPEVTLELSQNSEYLEGAMDFEKWILENYSQKALGLSGDDAELAKQLFIMNYWCDSLYGNINKFKVSSYLSNHTFNQYYYPNRQDVYLEALVLPAVFKYEGQKTTLKYGYEIEITAFINEITDEAANPVDGALNALGIGYMYMPMREFPVLVTASTSNGTQTAKADGQYDLTCAIPFSFTEKIEAIKDTNVNIARAIASHRSIYSNAFYKYEELNKSFISPDVKPSEKVILKDGLDAKIDTSLPNKSETKFYELISKNYTYSKYFKTLINVAQTRRTFNQGDNSKTDLLISCDNRISIDGYNFALHNNTTTSVDYKNDGIQNYVGSGHAHEVAIACEDDQQEARILFYTSAPMKKCLGDIAIGSAYYCNEFNGVSNWIGENVFPIYHDSPSVSLQCSAYEIIPDQKCPMTTGVLRTEYHDFLADNEVISIGDLVRSDCPYEHPLRCSICKTVDASAPCSNTEGGSHTMVKDDDCANCDNGKISEWKAKVKCYVCGVEYTVTVDDNSKNAVFNNIQHKTVDYLKINPNINEDTHNGKCFVVSTYNRKEGENRIESSFNKNYWQSISFSTYKEYMTLYNKLSVESVKAGWSSKMNATNFVNYITNKTTTEEYNFRYMGATIKLENGTVVVIFIPDNIAIPNADANKIKVENFISK